MGILLPLKHVALQMEEARVLKMEEAALKGKKPKPKKPARLSAEDQKAEDARLEEEAEAAGTFLSSNFPLSSLIIALLFAGNKRAEEQVLEDQRAAVYFPLLSEFPAPLAMHPLSVPLYPPRTRQPT